MNILQQAQQLLIASTLAQKLRPIDPGLDSKFDGGEAASNEDYEDISLPGRPANLAFSKSHGSSKIPNFEQLKESRQERGRLLHFFANHELLAIELFSLAIIRFRQLPEKYIRELALIIKQEQNHLSLYLSRMEFYGVEFGDYPLNDFFWKTMQPIKDPVQFITTINLVFEQANLDYAVFYAKLFRDLRDDETAKIFDVIYRDELGHVSHGLKWFDRLRSKSTSQWQAFEENLPKNIYPRHAKGVGFDVKNRSGLSFESAFLEKLQDNKDSRAQNQLVFNGGYEYEILSSKPLTKPQRILRQDMSWNFGLVAGPQSTLTVPQQPSKFFKDQLSTKIIYKNNFDTCLNNKIKNKFYWGDPQTNQTLFDKRYARILLNDFVDKYSTKYPYLLCEPDSTIEATELDHILAFAKNHDQIVIKSPFGTSGQSMLVLDTQRELSEHICKWIENHIERYGSVLVSKWFEKIADFGLQLHQYDNHSKFVGISRYFTDPKGRLSAYALNDPYIYLSKHVEMSMRDKNIGLRQVCKDLAEFVSKKIACFGFRGAIGIDMMLVQVHHKLYLHPMVEINPRYTFGHLALRLDKHIHKQSTGFWMFLKSPSLSQTQAEKITKKHPIQLVDQQIKSGAFFTSDPLSAQKVQSFVRVCPKQIL